jgi:hypothetical protein
MALTIAQAEAVSTKYYDKTLTQQVYEGSPFWAKLDADKQITTGGNSIQWPVRTSKLNSAKATGPRARVDFTSKDTRTAADIDWTYYDANTMINWDERVKNNGKQQIIDLLKDKSTELLEDIREKLYQAIFLTTTATEGTDLDTLDRIVDSAASYAGIAVADAASWAGVEDSTTTTLKLYGSGSLAAARNDATFGTDMPTLHITTRDLYSKYESLLQPQQRYEDKQMANLGFASLTFNAKPVVSDVFCPTGYWYGIDMKCMELRVHTDNNLDVGKWFSLEQAGFPKAMGKYVTWVGNLLARRRRTSFKFSALVATN